MKLYKAYNFRDKDPAIDGLRTLANDHFDTRSLNASELKEIEKSGGPSVNCMRQWFFGKTKRPQNATLEAAGRAMGYERKWFKKK